MTKSRIFGANTRAKAELMADEWWSKQNEFELVQRTIVAVGKDGPETGKAEQWAATIHFKEAS
jgi:hypothetical protein